MKKYIKNAFHGKVKLWKVFWLQNFLGSMILSVFGIFVLMYCFLGPSIMLSDDFEKTIWSYLKYIPLLITGFLWVGFAIWYEIVAIISLWKCSWNTNNRIWGYAARCAIVLSFLFAVLETIFKGDNGSIIF